jgi:fatty acid desaturase
MSRGATARAVEPGLASSSARRSAPLYSQAELQALKSRDNHTNFSYIGLVYLVVVATIAATMWVYSAIQAGTLSWWWAVPVTFVAIVSIGASQHQLGGVVHEGTHYILFANRKMNELVSDWLAAFPIYTSTYAFRLHHLAHHQFVNDPHRDPNFSQAKDSGHWLDFPLTHIELLVAIAKQLNPVRLVSYIVARARYSALGVDSNPYADSKRPGSPWAIRVGVLFAVGAPAVLIPLIAMQMWVAAAVALVVSWTATMAYYWYIPDAEYPQSRIEPVISHRATALNRIAYMGLLYGGLTIAEYATGAPVWGYFGLLWILPLFTTFPLFMVLREWLQHGNADRGRYTNSRIFYVNPIVRYAVFPWGMDIHLPHHLFASVPHYKLPDLHRLMLRDPEYAEKCRVVEGWSHRKTPDRPTVVDVLGPDYAPENKEVHVDDATLELAEINDKAAIQKHSDESRSAH